MSSTVAELQQLLLYYQVLTRLPSAAANASSNTTRSLLSPPSSTNPKLDLLSATNRSMSDLYREQLLQSAVSASAFPDLMLSESAISRLGNDNSRSAALMTHTQPLPRHFMPVSSGKIPPPYHITSLASMRPDSFGGNSRKSTSLSTDEDQQAESLSP